MLAALKGIYLVELDQAKTTFTWSFPAVDKDIESLIKHRSGLEGDLPASPLNEPLCHKYKQQWIYTVTFPAPEQSGDDKPDYLKATQYLLTIIVDNVYNPPAYFALIKALMTIYQDSKTTTAILTAYLQANAHAKISQQLTQSSTTISWSMSSHDQRMALIQPIHTILERFGIEAIVIWIAVLLKKRIFITSNNATELTNFTRSVVAFGGWHRKDAQIPSLRPLVNLNNPNEVNDIKNTPGCIAGILSTNTNIEHFDLWDLHIDLAQNALSIHNNAKQYFSLIKFHKTIAEFFLQSLTQAREAAAGNPDGELVIAQTVIKASMTKEKEIVELVGKLKDEATNTVTPDSIKGKVPANLESFIYNVAVAEGLV